MFEVLKGNVAGHSIVHKFGHSDNIDNSGLVPICNGEVYATPTSAVSLEFVSSDAADALDDAGMHEITVVGLDANFDEQTVVTAAHATDGLIAVAISGTWIRVYRAFISSSGTYATQTAVSHVGTITIRVAGAGATYAIIALDESFPLGQTQIGVYTVPAGKTAYLGNMFIVTESTKLVTIMGFVRHRADDVVSPYGAMRLFTVFPGTTDNVTLAPKTFMGPHPEKTDIGFMAVAETASAQSVSVDFEIVLVDD